jgi:hypothetical protein
MRCTVENGTMLVAGTVTLRGRNTKKLLQTTDLLGGEQCGHGKLKSVYQDNRMFWDTLY